MAKEFSKKFYASKEWEQTRDYILKRDKYKCQICGVSSPLEVHHKKHLTEENIYDVTVTLNPDNLITLCRGCHCEQHHKDRARGNCKTKLHEQVFDENGFLMGAPDEKFV